MVVRLVHTEFDLQDIAVGTDTAVGLVVRDFALTAIAARLSDSFGDQLCFKGGFVLRHVHGHQRFSQDIDATRRNPPRNKLDAEDVRGEIGRASVENLVRMRAAPPATDTARSLDFDHVDFVSPVATGVVSVEISYREDVLDPRTEHIGPPYFEHFPVTVLSLDEIIAEKLRAPCQRDRATDLADQAMILRREEHDGAHVRALATEKLKLVKAGNRHDRIVRRIAAMAPTYDETVRAVAPDAPSYAEASSIVLGRLRELMP